MIVGFHVQFNIKPASLLKWFWCSLLLLSPYGPCKKLGTQSLSEAKAARVWHCPLTLQLALRVKKDYSNTSTSHLCFHGML